MPESSWVEQFRFPYEAQPGVSINREATGTGGGAQSDASAVALIIPEKNEEQIRLENFLSEHFTEDLRDPANPVYQLKLKPELSFSQEQMQAFINVCVEYHVPYAPATMGQLWPSWPAVKANLPLPTSLGFSLENFRAILKGLSAFCYQLLSAGVQVTSILTLIKELNPDFNPFEPTKNLAILPPILLLSVLLMRNTHYFVSAISHLDVNAEQNKMDAKKSEFLEKLPFETSENELLYSLLTQPSLTEKLVQDAGVGAAWLVTMSGDIALVLELLKGDPLPLQLFFGAAVGNGDGYDGINQAFIAKLHQKVLEYHNQGKLPPKLRDTALLSPTILKFPLVWQYFKLVSPALVSILRWKAALDLLPMIRANTHEIPGGLVGYQVIMMLSAFKYGFVFSKFSFDEVFKQFLDEKDFSYKNDFSLSTVSRASVGALPVSMMAWFIAHANYLSVTQSTLYAALPAQLVTSLMLATMPRFANVYSELVECRFVENAWQQFGRIQKLDKAGLFLLGLMFSGIGMMNDKHHDGYGYLAATGQVMCFISGLSLLGNASESLMKMILFGMAGTLSYGTALINWVLNTLPLSNAPQTLDRDYFGLASVIIITAAALIAGVFVTLGDVTALLEKPRAETGDVEPFENGIVEMAAHKVSQGVSCVTETVSSVSRSMCGMFRNCLGNANETRDLVDEAGDERFNYQAV